MNKIRTNLYLDRDKLEVLKVLAVAEQSNVSDIVREAIDRVIADRMKERGPDLPSARKRFNALLERVGKRIESASESEVEEDISKDTLQRV